MSPGSYAQPVLYQATPHCWSPVTPSGRTNRFEVGALGSPHVEEMLV